MSQTLKHRGPDSSGAWVDSAAGIALAHRRLSVVDLSDHGKQPMRSGDERLVLVFNGEIYNHLELREKLHRAGAVVSWRGHSDSETLVECLAFWGVETTLREVVGMFAFAVWDANTHKLTLARDRMGEKPLYYARARGITAFGSELKSLQALPDLNFSMDARALFKFLQVGYIPETESVYEGIRKVPAGAWISIGPEVISESSWPEPQMYWTLQAVAESALRDPLRGDNPNEAVRRLEELLTSAISGQLMGDVPVGAFLSGGIDSSTITALMQKISPTPVKTFSIGFEGEAYDEMPYAAAIARVLGTDHHQLRLTEQDVKNTVPNLQAVYDEPFADSSQIPTLLVAKLAREHVRVSLSGDAGDELFAGYNRYILAGQHWSKLEKVPLVVREQVAKLLSRVPAARWDELLAPGSRSLPKGVRVAMYGDKIHKIAKILTSKNSLELYAGMVSQLDASYLKSNMKTFREAAPVNWPIQSDLVHQMMFVDSTSYLPGDILTKVDRATMAHSLESRMPFLDHRVVEFAWHLPLTLKIRDGQSKWVLREVLRNYVPDTYFDRPKMGFGGPLADWLRGPLREWANDLLAPSRLRFSDFIEEGAVTKMWQQHLSGTHNWEHGLWNVIMLESWLDSERSRQDICGAG